MSNIETIMKKNIDGELSIRSALETAAQGAVSIEKNNNNSHLLWLKYGNKNVFIRTVTHHYIGKLECVADAFLLISGAAWIADDGRFNECLAKGSVNEAEPFPNQCCIGIGSIIDICEWSHGLIREPK